MANRTPKTSPKGERAGKSPAETEAEKRRLAEARRAAAERAQRDEDEHEDDEEERDDDADEARDGDGDTDTGTESDDARDADDEDGDDEERDGDEDGDEEERAAPAAARRAAEAAVKAERVRSAKITEMAERAGLPKLGRSHVAKGTSAKRFGEIVLERMLKKQEERGGSTFAGTGAEEVSAERARKGSRDAAQRELADGEAHWRRVAGKPAKAA